MDRNVYIRICRVMQEELLFSKVYRAMQFRRAGGAFFLEGREISGSEQSTIRLHVGIAQVATSICK